MSGGRVGDGGRSDRGGSGVRPAVPTGRGAVPRRDDVAAAAVCVAFGVLMSVLPYALWWPRIGEPVWLADYDEVYYLQFAGQAYFHHPTSLGDPVVAAPGSGSAYSVVSLAPGDRRRAAAGRGAAGGGVLLAARGRGRGRG